MKQKITFALLMGIVTTGIVSFTIISANLGFVEHFLSIWTKSWLIGYSIAIPVILFIGPKVQKLVDIIFREREKA